MSYNMRRYIVRQQCVSLHAKNKNMKKKNEYEDDANSKKAKFKEVGNNVKKLSEVKSNYKNKKGKNKLSGGKNKPQNKKKNNKKKEWFELIDPYLAGKKLRQNLNSLTTLPGLPRSRSKQSIFYLDDRILDSTDKSTTNKNNNINDVGFDTDFGMPNSNVQSLFENPIYEKYDFDEIDYTPEVLVVGATGEVGRKIVQRLLRDPMQRFRVRVLVRDLYSKTLNLLGSGVTYCQGDLRDLESLEYAVTDVDKIVFCAGAPRMDEVNFETKFEDFVEENLIDLSDLKNKKSNNGQLKSQVDDFIKSTSSTQNDNNPINNDNSIDWQNMKAVIDIRAKSAEQVDYIGMQNLLQAYQNVRLADYGTSQAAKRSLFKFHDKSEDFFLFSLDDDDDYDSNNDDESTVNNYNDSFENTTEDNTLNSNLNKMNTNTLCSWMKNKFGHGVFTGRVPISNKPMVDSSSLSHIHNEYEATIVSGRLRSREDPELGVDLSNGFGGLLCRVCSDGGTYEAFIRTGTFATQGIEYVCEFETGTKNMSGNKSRNKFMSIRLPFAMFKPVMRNLNANNDFSDIASSTTSLYKGEDVRQIGFRFRSERNFPDAYKGYKTSQSRSSRGPKQSLLPFYLALSYIKVYRAQIEPEFVYISDARIPPLVKNRMVRHEARYIETEAEESSSNIYRILDESKMKKGLGDSRINRSDEETYFKYLGEQLLRNSGLRFVNIIGHI